VLDLVSAQVAAATTGVVRFVAAEVIGSDARMPAAQAGDADVFHDWNELRCFPPLPLV
jgi:hypothetical protein